MKINVKLLLITFTIVFVVTVSSSLIFFSLTNKIITSQQDQSILNSTSDFVFNFQVLNESLEESYKKIRLSNKSLNNIDLENSSVDFLFTLKDDKYIDFTNFHSKNLLNIRSKNLSLAQFLKDNPNIVLKYDVQNDNTYYYGKVITEKILNEIAEKIRANVALLVDQVPAGISNVKDNQVYYPAILEAFKNLRFKNKYDIYSGYFDDYDFYATLYNPEDLLTQDYKIGFMIFNTPHYAADLRYNSGMIALIIIVAGIALSLIFIMIFTTRFRRKISNLNYAANLTGKGEMNFRVPIEGNDELDHLGAAFNSMLDQLKTQKQTEQEYTEFITLLNQNPTLDQIADAAIQKIIKSTRISFGVIYLVENETDLKNIASYGIKQGINESERNFDYYKNAIQHKDIIEFKFNQNNPIVKTGISEIKIKYIAIVPIIYSNKVVALVELASEEIPDHDIKKYLLSIREQLAIGIINGSSYERLENLVGELKKLNADYENQNKELKKVYNELESKAEQLNEERLKALEASNLKSQFLTNMTHELKTPLNSILGLTGLIKNDSALTDSHKRRLTVIIRNSKKLLNLINNILEFAKAEAGKTTVKNETFVLNDLLKDINFLIQPNAVEKGLNYVCDIPENHQIIIHTDKNKLEQILINLLNNSIKFTENGKVQLSVYIQQDNTLIFNVSDTGIGIDEKDRKAIFEEFRQADGTLTRQYDGTGLGLSICKKFVELMDGTLTLESEVNKGSKFTIKIPNAVVKTEDTYSDKDNEQLSERKRVMILDESKTNKKLIGDYLSLNNYRLVESLNEENISSKIVEQGVQCVILNQAVFNNGGWETLSALKSNSKFKDLITIITATYEPKNYGYGLAVFDYLSQTNFKENFQEIYDNVKITQNKKSLKLLSILEDEKINKYLSGEFSAEVLESKNLSEQIKDEHSQQTDLILFDLKNIENIELVDELKHNRSTRHIEFIGILPEELSKDFVVGLSKKLNDIMMERKHHILDVLKIFRNRLNIAENELARTKLLMEEDPFETKSVNREQGDLKILIVDDDQDTLYTVGEIVKSNGYKPLFAKNGVECILGLKSEIPDLILLDIMMPKMDGFETLREIRKHPEYNEVKVIALTAYAMLDDKDIIDRSGFDEVITKPIDSKVISEKLNEIFQQKEIS